MQMIITLLGGIGLFLYGMNLLGESLQRLAGASLEKTLEKLTNNKWKGLALGTGVTAIIQSSAATTIMLVGFVNVGIMKLVQTIPVIMGANIGTTVTGQILRLGDMEGSATWVSLLKPTGFAPIVIAVGAFILLCSKKKKHKDVASILMGLGILFFGMTTMESALSPLRESEQFRSLFTMFRNPVLGVLLGAGVTAILQSSSASVGILQAIASTGTVTFSMAAPIIIGQNVGKCITVILASIGTNKNAKRVVIVDLMLNIFGAILFIFGIYGFQALVGFPFWEEAVNRGDVANFHTLFNVVTGLVFFPFTNLLDKLAKQLLKEDAPSKMDTALKLLDPIFLSTPTVALEQCKKVIFSMGDVVKENLDLSVRLATQFDERGFAELQENEKFLDKAETDLGNYLVKITGQGISKAESRLANEMLHCVSDFERIGDHCVNIAEVGQYNEEQKIQFTQECLSELELISSAVHKILEMTLSAFRTEDVVTAYRVEPLEEVIDGIKELLRNHHIERLQAGTCSVQGGISFLEILTSMERISDHCSSIAIYVIQRISGQKTTDKHEALRTMHSMSSEEYKALYIYYKQQYYDPARLPSDSEEWEAVPRA